MKALYRQGTEFHGLLRNKGHKVAGFTLVLIWESLGMYTKVSFLCLLAFAEHRSRLVSQVFGLNELSNWSENFANQSKPCLA